MKKIILLNVILFSALFSKAQTTAMDFNTVSCSGTPVHLFSDLDGGKAVILFYYMASCSSCPPQAQKIQVMINNINAIHPGKVKAYAFPFNNTTGCTYSQSWVASNSVPIYVSMDSGAASVAHYGGFGMPTVVLVGGSNHRVMFSSQSFSTSDTTTMKDSILALIAPTGINETHNYVSNINVYPNPAVNTVTISMDLKMQSNLLIDMVDVAGKQVAVISNNKSATGTVLQHFNTAALASGIYTIRVNVNGEILNKQINVVH
ncbi:MAG: T9SS type A sorting domain-containing protein [Taibaiella sp.]|nr:T9SS type A sorting domain-containing protein [Taibaiella sp.]